MDGIYDVIVVGGGPAGLTAALYLARARFRCLVLEKDQFGGQIAITEEVVNYPGVERISGRELTDTMRRQAESFGAEFLLEKALDFTLDGDVKVVRTDGGTYRCLGILLATGARPRNVGFRGEQAYKGRGVAYCATCDGEFFTGKDVFVVGGGYAAAEESVFLTKFARHVTILIRKGDFSCAASVADRARNHEKITVLTNTVLEEVSGDNGLNYARYQNIVTGEVTEYRSAEGEHFGVFVFAGYAPDTEQIRNVIHCDEQGYIITDATQKTSVAGVYAAGDVCRKSLRQVVTATADGALAATELERYVRKMQEKTGIRPEPAPATAEQDDLFDGQMKQQLEQTFDRMETSLLLKLYLDERPISAELENFTGTLVKMTRKLKMQVVERGSPDPTAPYVRVCREDGTQTGLAFHGVPGGHEFTSFVLGLYNLAGPGQKIDRQIAERIAEISDPVDIKILVTLSCTLCPELVKAAQRIAADNSKVTAEVYDIRHFEALRQRYNVMSVPCMVINDEKIVFGKKNMQQILDLL